MALVNFVRGTKPAALTGLDANTIYFFSDTKEIYLGSTPYSGNLDDLKEELQELIDAKADAEDLEALEETVGTLTTTTIPGIESDIEDIEGRLDDLEGADYLTKTEAENTYAKKTDLNAYLTEDDAESTYAKKGELADVKTTAEKGVADAKTAKDAADAAASAAEKAQQDATAAGNQAATNKDDITGLKAQVGNLETTQAQQDTKISALETWLGDYYTEDTFDSLEDVLKEIVGGEIPDNIIQAVTGTKGIKATTGAQGKVTLEGVVDTTSDEYLTVGDNGFKLTLPETATTDYTVTVTTAATPTTDMAKTYEIKQGSQTYKIDIPKDLVVSEGTIVDQDGDGEEGTFIKLVLNNGEELYIDVANLVDEVEANNTSTTVEVTVTDGNKIGAAVKAGSITNTELSTGVKADIQEGKDAYTALTWGELDD